MTARLRAVLGCVLAATLLAGCVRLPESGPVVQDGAEVGPSGSSGAFYVPSGPRPGESPVDITRHFLEAMTATPLQTGVAREFLTEQAAAAWEPDRSTTTFDGPLRPVTSTAAAVGRTATEVSVRLPDANRLDRRGAWLGEVPPRAAQLSFPMVREAGEWRISEPPDGLIVPEAWFESRFRQVSLYFFDPSASILVPEPVFVPAGEQLATTLVRRLIEGPGPALSRTSRTFLPQEAAVELSVTVSAAGVADVALTGGRATPDAETTGLVLAQLARTLRQDPAIEAFRVSLSGEPLRLPDGSSRIPVEHGEEYAPWVSASTTRLFAVRDGLVVDVAPDDETTPVRGPFGTERLGIGEIAVDMPGDRVAAVSDDGSAVLTGAVDDADTPVRTVLQGGADLAKPAWDHAGRLWVLDRTDTGARLVLVAGDRRREVDVPGVTGQEVTSILVSRDGSRLVAAVRGPSGDRVVAHRVRYGEGGEVESVSSGTTVLAGGEDPLRVASLGWSSPTTLTVVDRGTTRTWTTRQAPVDGSLASTDDLTVVDLDREPVRRVISSPAPELPTYLLTSDGLVELGASRPLDVDGPLSGLTYAG